MKRDRSALAQDVSRMPTVFLYKSDPVRGRQWAEVFARRMPEIDFRICMYCGLCTEACPYEAIQPGGPMDDAVYQFEEMYRDKHSLTRVARKFLENNNNTYPNQRSAPSPDADFHRL